MPKNEPVEIKVTVASSRSGGVDVADVMAGLGLIGAGVQRFIWFLEDCTPGLPTALPLLESGVILRLRQEPAGTDDSTVKLRPCRRSQLTRAWEREAQGSDWKYRIEEDWAGSRRTLAASCVSDLADGKLGAAVAGDAGWGGLFHPRQEQYLADCADLRVSLDGLVALGPINSVRPEDLLLGEFIVAAERWTVDDLDFLELSIREEGGRAKAVATQARFVATLAERGIPVLEGQTKTRTVLEHLARQLPADL